MHGHKQGRAVGRTGPQPTDGCLLRHVSCLTTDACRDDALYLIVAVAPQVITPGVKKVLRGKGMPISQSPGTFGNMHINFEVRCSHVKAQTFPLLVLALAVQLL